MEQNAENSPRENTSARQALRKQQRRWLEQTFKEQSNIKKT